MEEYDDGKYLAVSCMHIRYGKEVDSITITYKKPDGTMLQGERRGGKGGEHSTTITLEEDEGIVAIAGTKHEHSHVHGLEALSFKTDKDRTFSIVTDSAFDGEVKGELFSYEASEGMILGGIRGFAGRFLNTLDPHWVAKDVDHMDMIDIPDSPFKVKKKKLIWSEHVKNARKLGYNVAAVTDKEQEKKIIHALKADDLLKNERFWIGGKRVKGMVFKWLDGQRAEYYHWHRFEPSNSGGKQNCIEIMQRDEKWAWNDDNCSVEKFALYELDDALSGLSSVELLEAM